MWYNNNMTLPYFHNYTYQPAPMRMTRQLMVKMDDKTGEERVKQLLQDAPNSIRQWNKGEAWGKGYKQSNMKSYVNDNHNINCNNGNKFEK